MDWIAGIITIAAAASGMLLGWIVQAQGHKREIEAAAREDGALKTDVEYIKRGVDDIRADIRVQGQKLDTLAERVARVEESAKQAHLRLDRLEKVEE